MNSLLKSKQLILKIKKLIFPKAKEKYRGMFEIQKSEDKTSSGEIGLDIRTHTKIFVIPMGTNCAPLLTDIFLYSFEAEFIQLERKT